MEDGSRVAGLVPWAETNSLETGYRSMINASLRSGNGFILILSVKRRRAMLASKCAGINRHVVGDERALQKRSSDSILTLSLAWCVARRTAKRR